MLINGTSGLIIKQVEASYEDLTVEEHWGHGGPWMSIESCSIHLNYLLTYNQYPIVAKVDDKVAGELEVYIGKEKGILGKTAFIDVLTVHGKFRGRGIGGLLINKALKIALENKCDTLSV